MQVLIWVRRAADNGFVRLEWVACLIRSAGCPPGITVVVAACTLEHGDPFAASTRPDTLTSRPAKRAGGGRCLKGSISTRKMDAACSGCARLGETSLERPPRGLGQRAIIRRGWRLSRSQGVHLGALHPPGMSTEDVSHDPPSGSITMFT